MRIIDDTYFNLYNNAIGLQSHSYERARESKYADLQYTSANTSQKWMQRVKTKHTHIVSVSSVIIRQRMHFAQQRKRVHAQGRLFSEHHACAGTAG